MVENEMAEIEDLARVSCEELDDDNETIAREFAAEAAANRRP
jgi:hypothetical protein